MSSPILTAPFVREVATEVPTVGADLTPGARRIKVFCKGPDQGINADTGVLVVLHGLAGRHNDISYKRMRRDLSSAHNLLVVGVNYLGTDVYVNDYEHMSGCFKRHAVAIGEHLQDATAPGYDGMVRLILNPSKYWTTPCKAAEIEVEQGLANDFWDYGAIQALDVLSALTWLQGECARLGVAPDWRRLHLTSQSAGCQVAAMLFKFIPNGIASHLQIGGVWLGAKERETLVDMLLNPYGRLGDAHLREVSGKIAEKVLGIAAQRAPVGFTEGPSRSRATREHPDILDEICLRDVDEPEHWPGGKVPGKVSVVHGSRDQFVTPQNLLACLSARFSQAHLDVKLVEQPDIDGTMFVSCDHEVTKNMPSVVEKFGPALWAKSRLEAPLRLAGDVTRRYQSFNGEWVLKLGEAPELWFESTPGWKHPNPT